MSTERNVNLQGKENPKQQGVIFNAYPDSIGKKLSDAISLLSRPELKNVFSGFYLLPTFFNSDLDRGFSIIDYNLNQELVSKDDLKALDKLHIELKLDIVLNHLSVASPQFQDLLKNGKQSVFHDFFIQWNNFWEGHGKPDEEGVIVPEDDLLKKLFMRKPGLPVLKVYFADGSMQPFWNTFYQDVSFGRLRLEELQEIEGVGFEEAQMILEKINENLDAQQGIEKLDFGAINKYKDAVLSMLRQKRKYLGQMDINAKSGLVWDFYEETLAKLKAYGCRIVRLDAFAYLHKEIGQSNFFNVPGTWEYLERMKQIADRNNLSLLPEIHSEFGAGLHDEVAAKGYRIYDFFLPGLLIHAIEKGTNKALLKWANQIISKAYQTINMLGCHDGIPVLDLKGKQLDGTYHEGLLSDEEIEDVMSIVIRRGGRVKSLYGPSGAKLSYYQVNATYFSALGEDERKLLLARAIQVFMPGVPQVWYLDLFAGKNDYAAADAAGSGGHKEINRTSLSLDKIEAGLKRTIVLKQLEILHLRNTSKAFLGDVFFADTMENEVHIRWSNQFEWAELRADLLTQFFTIMYTEKGVTVKKSYNNFHE